ncbi:hypothetical protein [Streptomyces griseofuscus]|uniref:hypothetical protein n=1 Tax=Streptomyces griseofuscus TaxID=146922 RepID=UPI003407FDAE
MSSWFEERRADKAADAERLRESKAFEAKLRRDERRKDREEQREITTQKRRDRAQRRAARAARREKALTPGNVYRKGTLALVAASALASLPAQVMHFVKVSLMLLPLPLALEGSAWVMAAGVAYADERKLPSWVRWLLRGLSMGAAGYAARINYTYGAETSASVAWGLAGVTVMGPLVFEVRQWVTTLTFDAAEKKRRAEEKARAKHERKRKKDHEDVVKLADRLVSAAPFGKLAFEDAFRTAWEIFYGTEVPGMTPALHAHQLAARKDLAAAMDAANGSPVSTRGRLLQLLHPAPSALLSAPGSSQVASDLPPASERPQKTPQKGGRKMPPPHRRTKGDSVPFSSVARIEAALERGGSPRRIAAVNGHQH